MDPKEEWERFMRGQLSPMHWAMLQHLMRRHEVTPPWQLKRELEDFRDAQLRATSPISRAMSDRMLADCLSSNRAK